LLLVLLLRGHGGGGRREGSDHREDDQPIHDDLPVARADRSSQYAFRASMSFATAFPMKSRSMSGMRIRGSRARVRVSIRIVSFVPPSAGRNWKTESHTVPWVSLTMRMRSFATHSVISKSIVLSVPFTVRDWRKPVPAPEVAAVRNSRFVTPPTASAKR